MNKNDLAAAVADAAKLTRAEGSRVVDAVIGAIETALKKGDEVRLVGFGTFVVSRRKASDGRNPKTGERIKIPASKSVRFKPGQALREAVN
ncbi:MAG: HU family DNA-binding protein [Alphaproteobacteria bacterium]|nr:HU family DNA-binding protein [Alphaproteobacteria bacterium]